VALDVARILALGPDRLAKTDISDQALEQLRASTIREIVVIGRRGPTEASFTTKELLALARTPGVDVVVRPEELQAGRTGPAAPVRKVEVLTELLGHRPGADRRITLRFLAAPTEIIGDGWVEGVRLCRTRLLTDEDGVVRAVPTGDFEELACRLVFRSVGYRGSPVPGLPFDDERGIVPNGDGRVIDPGTGDPVQGVYAAGWIKRGPSGSIGTNRKCAKDTVEHLLNDYRAGRLPVPSEPGDIADELPQHIGLGGWRLINDHELDAGRRQHRPRVKLVDLAELLAVARRDG
jgi:ferredoxin--NADP+ reductase